MIAVAMHTGGLMPRTSSAESVRASKTVNGNFQRGRSQLERKK